MVLSRRAFLASTALSPFAISCEKSTAPAVITASKTASVRNLARVASGIPTVDGAGVRLWKLLGSQSLPLLDPFLMLDRFRSSNSDDFIRGFPDHPHRGFETVTIMLDGHVVHRDSVGNHGDISKDGIQWMTAGRGIIHSEMPRASEVTGALFGFQLWVNLPARLKMSKPRYQDIASGFPKVQVGDASTRIIAGLTAGQKGPVEGIVSNPLLLDVSLEAGARFVTDLEPGHTAFVVPAKGAIAVGDTGERVADGELGVLSAGSRIELLALEPARALLFAAAPIGEPVARRGPFVMNTDAELRQAFEDYQTGRLTQG